MSYRPKDGDIIVTVSYRHNPAPDYQRLWPIGGIWRAYGTALFALWPQVVRPATPEEEAVWRLGGGK